ncbi:MAG: hypothetical protein KAW41_06440 [Candidatus Diapherotrites archaeon]|nr:hypothetical protein [Candidatus Diapherotrites archaeon]
MRGSLTLEFILSLVLLIASAGAFFALANAQIENTVVASTQYKAEAMAMSIGSAINHFAALEPGPGSYMELNFTGLPESTGQASFGMPGFSAFATTEECNITYDSRVNQIIVEVTVYRMDSSAPTIVTARYPIVNTANIRRMMGCPTSPVFSVGCDEGLKAGFDSDFDTGWVEVKPL